MSRSRNTFAAKMQAALDARIAAEKAYESGDETTGRKKMLEAHDITSAAACEAALDDLATRLRRQDCW